MGLFNSLIHVFFFVIKNYFLFSKPRKTRKIGRICLIPNFFFPEKTENIKNTKFRE